MDLRLKFNEDEINYDRYRPTYTDALFREIIRYSGVARDSKLLEIGIGTGQATLPFLQRGCEITAVELGDRLSAYARHKFAAYGNLTVINADFGEHDVDPDAYDLVYSATAFHWLPEERSYDKVWLSLKTGGTVALFWNHPWVQDAAMHVDMQKVYARYRPETKPGSRPFGEADCAKYRDLLRGHGFTHIEVSLYRQTRVLDADDYVGLLFTYSDHRAMSDDIRGAFADEIRHVIDRNGGSVTIYDTMDLYLARK